MERSYVEPSKNMNGQRMSSDSLDADPRSLGIFQYPWANDGKWKVAPELNDLNDEDIFFSSLVDGRNVAHCTCRVHHNPAPKNLANKQHVDYQKLKNSVISSASPQKCSSGIIINNNGSKNYSSTHNPPYLFRAHSNQMGPSTQQWFAPFTKSGFPNHMTSKTNRCSAYSNDTVSKEGTWPIFPSHVTNKSGMCSTFPNHMTSKSGTCSNFQNHMTSTSSTRSTIPNHMTSRPCIPSSFPNCMTRKSSTSSTFPNRMTSNSGTRNWKPPLPPRAPVRPAPPCAPPAPAPMHAPVRSPPRPSVKSAPQSQKRAPWINNKEIQIIDID